MPERVNNFAIKIATVNGTGSASANSLLMKSIFRSGVPVMGKNYFPSNIQGLPTWYEIRVTKDSYVARSGKVDLMVAMNAETYTRDVREVTSGGYLIYDSTWPRPALLARDDITVLGVPLAKLCNENFNGVRTRILMKNICYAGVLAALLDLDIANIRELLAETYAKKPALVESNMKAIELGYNYTREDFECPLPMHVAPALLGGSKTTVISSSTATPRQDWRAFSLAPPWVRGIRSRLRRRSWTRTRHSPTSFAPTRSPARRTSRSSRPKTSSPPSAWCWARRGTARARSPPPPAPASRS